MTSGESQTYDVFLSYNRRDRGDVEYIANRLTELGVSSFLDLWYLAPGTPWPQALEDALRDCGTVAVVVGSDGLGPWQQREAMMALDRQASDPSRRVVPVLLPGADPALGFLRLNTWIDLREGLEDADGLASLAGAARAELAEPSQQTTPPVSPYRGLRPFREEDAPLFFGRDAFVHNLADALSQHSMVGVVGSSGSGKSSVVMAGLVPLLRKDPEFTWEIRKLVPGGRPFHALAASMMPLLNPNAATVDLMLDVGRVGDGLGAGSLEIRDLVAQALDKQPGTDRLLLVVDQWEELYTHVGSDDLRNEFIGGLLNALAHQRLKVVLTVRGDFYGHLIAHRGLADLLQKGVVNISAMTQTELSDAITGPADVVGVRFEDGLVQRILGDVGKEPGNMPLLQFVLDELWKARE